MKINLNLELEKFYKQGYGYNAVKFTYNIGGLVYIMEGKENDLGETFAIGLEKAIEAYAVHSLAANRDHKVLYVNTGDSSVTINIP